MEKLITSDSAGDKGLVAKKTWATPELNVISKNDVQSGTVPLGVEGILTSLGVQSFFS